MGSIVGKSKRKKKIKYVHCRKRHSVMVNDEKWQELEEITQAFAKQKNFFLCQYNGRRNIQASYSFRELRSEWVARKYKSPFGLQNRGWKLALKDAVAILDRYWAAQRKQWKSTILQSKLSDEQKHYLCIVIFTNSNLYEYLQRGVSFQTKVELEIQSRKKCQRFLQNLMKKTVKSLPRVKIARSFLAEPETYRVFTNNNTQYISLTSKHRGKRIAIPLIGNNKITGEIRIILDDEKQRIEVHQCEKTKKQIQPPQGESIGVDWGITEVATDNHGKSWGDTFGETVCRYSEELKDKGQKRNKLHQVAKKYLQNGLFKKAAKIIRHNLGYKKKHKLHKQRKAHLQQQIHHEIKNIFNEYNPKIFVCEDISHMRGKAKSRKLSRMVTSWLRSTLSESVESNVLRRGSLLKQVNCAYSSQICSCCGFVAKKNRKGDKFKCLFCGYTGMSDHTSAIEILRRESDCEITLMTRKAQVKKILDERFRRRLQRWDFSFLHSQVNWNAIYHDFSDVVDDIRSKLDNENWNISSHVSGKTSDISCTSNGNCWQSSNSNPRNQSKSESHSSMELHCSKDLI